MILQLSVMIASTGSSSVVDAGVVGAGGADVACVVVESPTFPNKVAFVGVAKRLVPFLSSYVERFLSMFVLMLVAKFRTFSNNLVPFAVWKSIDNRLKSKRLELTPRGCSKTTSWHPS